MKTCTHVHMYTYSCVHKYVYTYLFFTRLNHDGFNKNEADFLDIETNEAFSYKVRLID